MQELLKLPLGVKQQDLVNRTLKGLSELCRLLVSIKLLVSDISFAQAEASNPP